MLNSIDTYDQTELQKACRFYEESAFVQFSYKCGKTLGARFLYHFIFSTLSGFFYADLRLNESSKFKLKYLLKI